MLTLSYGGGKQTASIICLILEGRLPVPDLFVMADTGREVATTFEYLNQWVQPALEKIGRRVEIAGHDLALVDIVSKHGYILLPAYTRENGRIGKLPTYCSNEWKQDVIRRWLRQKGVNDTDVWLGISTEEAERMKPSGLKWYRHIYPLIEIEKMNRQGCINTIQAHGWPVPHKSRCYMCPNQSAESWKQLRTDAPADFEKAVSLEKELQLLDRNIYFHKQAISLPEAVDQSGLQSDMFDGCDSGYCFV